MIDAMPNLLDSASNLRAALLRRDFSARDLLAATLDAFARLNPVLNAIVFLDVESARQAARASDERIARGDACARMLETLGMCVKAPPIAL